MGAQTSIRTDRYSNASPLLSKTIKCCLFSYTLSQTKLSKRQATYSNLIYYVMFVVLKQICVYYFCQIPCVVVSEKWRLSVFVRWQRILIHHNRPPRCKWASQNNPLFKRENYFVICFNNKRSFLQIEFCNRQHHKVSNFFFEGQI